MNFFITSVKFFINSSRIITFDDMVNTVLVQRICKLEILLVFLTKPFYDFQCLFYLLYDLYELRAS